MKRVFTGKRASSRRPARPSSSIVVSFPAPHYQPEREGDEKTEKISNASSRLGRPMDVSLLFPSWRRFSTWPWGGGKYPPQCHARACGRWEGLAALHRLPRGLFIPIRMVRRRYRGQDIFRHHDLAFGTKKKDFGYFSQPKKKNR